MDNLFDIFDILFETIQFINYIIKFFIILIAQWID